MDHQHPPFPRCPLNFLPDPISTGASSPPTPRCGIRGLCSLLLLCPDSEPLPSLRPPGLCSARCGGGPIASSSGKLTFALGSAQQLARPFQALLLSLRSRPHLRPPLPPRCPSSRLRTCEHVQQGRETGSEDGPAAAPRGPPPHPTGPRPESCRLWPACRELHPVRPSCTGQSPPRCQSANATCRFSRRSVRGPVWEREPCPRQRGRGLAGPAPGVVSPTCPVLVPSCTWTLRSGCGR